MADKKISALTAASTPLAGTEVLPIVQSGATVKVAVSDLTAGRAISATQVTLTTGNLIVANGQGVDFSATPGTGTSELLADYEEGTWTPAYIGTTTNPTVSYTSQLGRYTKVGRIVNVSGFIQATPSVAGVGSLQISGLPFTSANVMEYAGSVGYCSQFTVTGAPISIVAGQNATVMNLYKTASADARSGTYLSVDAATDISLSGGYFYFSATYIV